MDEPLAWVIAWIVVNSLIGYWLGKLKAQPGSGAVLSVLLGPIGWLFIAALKDSRGRCRECLGIVESGARVCRHCGRDLIITYSR